MAVTAPGAVSGIPSWVDDCFVVGHGSGTALEINPGDYVSYSGQYIIASHTAVTYWKVSGLGIAITRNPAFDPHGRQVVNSAVVVARHGIFRVSGNFSGQPALGVIAAPDMTGSGVNAATGLTGLGSVWMTATPANSRVQAITYDFRDLASAISAYVTDSATGSALLPASGLFSANATSAQVEGVSQVIGWYNSGPGGTGQMDIALWPRNADYY